jgi:hypothetical protein
MKDADQISEHIKELVSMRRRARYVSVMKP